MRLSLAIHLLRASNDYMKKKKEKERTPKRIVSFIDLNPEMGERSSLPLAFFSSPARQSDLTGRPLSKCRRERRLSLAVEVFKSLDIGVCAALPAPPDVVSLFPFLWNNWASNATLPPPLPLSPPRHFSTITRMGLGDPGVTFVV